MQLNTEQWWNDSDRATLSSTKFTRTERGQGAGDCTANGVRSAQ